MNNQTDITELLNESFTAHGLTDEKLSHLTNVPKRFITAIRTGDFSRLPAEPYIRGYLIKIAAVLKIDSSELITIYKESVGRKRRNKIDKLPQNRFKPLPMNKKWLLGIAAAALVGIFLFFRLDAVLGIPELTVAVPEQTSVESLSIEGHVRPGDALTINGEIVYTDEVGNFKHAVLLEPGINTLNFLIKRFLGRETKVIKTVYYEPIINNIDNTNQ